MLDFTPLITTVATAIVGLLVWFVQEKRKEKALMAMKEDILQAALIVLIRNQLVNAHRTAIDMGALTTSQKQSFVEMFDLYIKLGGNGSTSHLLDDINRVQLVAD